MNKDTLRFIDRLYKDLYLDDQVLHHSSGNKYDKFNNIKEYMEKLEDIHTKVTETGSYIELLRKMYHGKYVIKEENIPKKYYQVKEEIINKQKASIDKWLEYFIGDDSKIYPFWAKYWAFQGMLKLGNFDKGKGEFTRRREDTVGPFPELNKEALAKSMDVLLKVLNKEEVEDEELKILIKEGAFGKIYSYVLEEVLDNNKNETKGNEGKWIKYNQGSDHTSLVNSLQGYNTGWCIDLEDTAKRLLSKGDFYVYYTLDKNNEYKFPRIVIGMENNQISEIRGVAEHQNLEFEMIEVLSEKLKEFPDAEESYKKLEDMKCLSKLYKKHKNNEKLTQEELIILYEIKEEIDGFGYGKDLRIEEIQNEIDSVEDLNIIFKGIKTFNKSLNLNGLTKANGLVLPQTIEGDLKLSRLINVEGLVLPQNIEGNLELNSLISAEGLVLPKSIGLSLELSSLTSIESVVFPQTIGVNLILSKLTSAKNLVLPQSVGNSLDLSNLISAEGLVLPKSVGWCLNLSSLTSIEGVTLPQTVGGNLDLSNLISAEGLVLPKRIGLSLNLSSLTSAKDLVLPQNIDGDLYLNSLESIEGLLIPENLTYNIYLKDICINASNIHEYCFNKSK